MPELATRRAITVAEAAHQAHTSKKLIYGEIAEGNLRATRIGRGRSIRIQAESFDAWIAGQKPAVYLVDPRIAEIVAAAPPLTDAQIEEIVAIIRADGVA